MDDASEGFIAISDESLNNFQQKLLILSETYRMVTIYIFLD